MKKIIGLFFIVFVFSGCFFARMAIKTPVAVVFEEDAIYTLKEGTPIIGLVLDGKSVGEVSFPYDMKLVAPHVLVRQEKELNDALLAKTKLDKERSGWVRIIMVIMGIVGTTLSGLFGAWVKSKIEGGSNNTKNKL